MSLTVIARPPGPATATASGAETISPVSGFTACGREGRGAGNSREVCCAESLR